ncbi:hypothetical protein, partial [Streptomyces sp. NPDC058728]
AKLKGVQARETWALPARDQAKMAGHISVIIAKGVHGQKSSAKSERGVDQIWSNAEAALTAEIGEAQKAKAKEIQEAAAAKVAARADRKGWW